MAARRISDSSISRFSFTPCDLQSVHRSIRSTLTAICESGGSSECLEYMRKMDDQPAGVRFSVLVRIVSHLDTTETMKFLEEYLKAMSKPEFEKYYNPLFEFALRFMLEREYLLESFRRTKQAIQECSTILEKEKKYPCEPAKILAMADKMLIGILDCGKSSPEWDEPLKLYDAAEKCFTRYATGPKNVSIQKPAKNNGASECWPIEKSFLYHALITMAKVISLLTGSYREDGGSAVKRFWYQRASLFAGANIWLEDALFVHEEILQTLVSDISCLKNDEPEMADKIGICCQKISEELRRTSERFNAGAYGKKHVSVIIGFIDRVADHIKRLHRLPKKIIDTKDYMNKLLKVGFDMAKKSLGVNHPRFAHMASLAAYMSHRVVEDGEQFKEYEEIAKAALKDITAREEAGDEQIVIRNLEAMSMTHRYLGQLYIRTNSLQESDQHFDGESRLFRRYSRVLAPEEEEEDTTAEDLKHLYSKERAEKAVSQLKKALSLEESRKSKDANKIDIIRSLLSHNSDIVRLAELQA